MSSTLTVELGADAGGHGYLGFRADEGLAYGRAHLSIGPGMASSQSLEAGFHACDGKLCASLGAWGRIYNSSNQEDFKLMASYGLSSMIEVSVYKNYYLGGRVSMGFLEDPFSYSLFISSKI